MTWLWVILISFVLVVPVLGRGGGAGSTAWKSTKDKEIDRKAAAKPPSPPKPAAKIDRPKLQPKPKPKKGARKIKKDEE